MRYYTDESEPGKALAQWLGQIEGVREVEIDGCSRTVRIAYAGPISGLLALEKTSEFDPIRTRIVSHARMVFNFTADDGADRSKLEASLAAVPGVRTVAYLGGTAEVLADLRVLDAGAVGAAAKARRFKVSCAGHAYVTVTLAKGDVAAFERELLATDGILTARRDADGGLHLWIDRDVSDQTLKLVAELAEVEVKDITRR